MPNLKSVKLYDNSNLRITGIKTDSLKIKISGWSVIRAKECSAENLSVLASGNSTAVKMVARGQADICFTDTDDVYAGQRNGLPIKMNFLNQGAQGPLAIPNTAAVIKGGPNPEAAAELMEFLLSKKLEEMLAESDSHNWPINPDLQKRFKKYEINRSLDIDYPEVASHLNTAIKTAGEILR